MHVCKLSMALEKLKFDKMMKMLKDSIIVNYNIKWVSKEAGVNQATFVAFLIAYFRVAACLTLIESPGAHSNGNELCILMQIKFISLTILEHQTPLRN